MTYVTILKYTLIGSSLLVVGVTVCRRSGKASGSSFKRMSRAFLFAFTTTVAGGGLIVSTGEALEYTGRNDCVAIERTICSN